MDIQFQQLSRKEQFYCFPQSQQISMQTGLIGHVKGSWLRNPDFLVTEFRDFREELKSDAFREDLDDVFRVFYKGENGLDLLKDHQTLEAFCKTHPEMDLRDNQHFGFRVNTDHYSYLIRVAPQSHYEEFYCYCYVRQWLDRHMQNAEKGIRFITPDYKEKFRIEDGDKIRVVRSDGTHRDQRCRYIDDYHFEIGYLDVGVYHICQFAEKVELSRARDVIPLRASLPDKCFSYLESTGEMIVITKGEKGYVPTGYVGENITPREAVDAANEAIGVTRAQEEAMVAGSMFGWHVPGADPRNYSADGTPIRPKEKDRGEAR